MFRFIEWLEGICARIIYGPMPENDPYLTQALIKAYPPPTPEAVVNDLLESDAHFQAMLEMYLPAQAQRRDRKRKK